MKTFQNSAAQGDLLIRRIDRLPSDAVPIEPKDGRFVLAHSETGHHHVISSQGVRAYSRSDHPLLLILVITDPQPIQHLRAWDTHEALMPARPGVYEIYRQREMAPEGWRRVAD